MKYEDYSGFEYGYPPPDPRDYYGIWSPAFDCFIFVHHDINRLIKMQWLLSSKLLVMIFKFDHSVMEKNLIDNTCCEHWTITKEKQIDLALVYKKGGSVESCDVIKRQQHDSMYVEDLQFIRRWSLFLNHWCGKIDRHNQLKIYVNTIIQSDKINKIYQALWLSQDIPTAQQILNETDFNH